MKHLLLAATLLISTLGWAQDFETERVLDYPTQGRSVVTTLGPNGYAFSPLVNGMQVHRMGNEPSLDGSRQFTNLGGPAVLSDAIQADNGLFVAGAIQNNGLERFFVARISPSSLNMLWIHIEPPRSVGTRALQLHATNAQVVAAVTVEGGVGAVAFNPSTGAENWRTTVPTPNQDAHVMSDPQQNVYLIANRLVGSVTEMFVRSVTSAGFFRWERGYAEVRQGVDGVGSALEPIVVGMTRDTTLSTVRLFRINPSDGSVTSLSQPLSFPGFISRPLVHRGQNEKIRVYLTNTANLSRFEINTDVQLSQVTSQSAGFSGFDVGVANDSGAIVSAVQVHQGGQIFLGLEPDAVWSPQVVSSEQVAEDMVMDQFGRYLVVGPGPLPATSQLRRIHARPVARDDLFEAFFNEIQVVVPPSGVLANDLGAAGAQLSLVSQPQGGTVTLNNDGGFTYTAVRAEHRVDSFTYRMQRGNLSSFGTVKILRQPTGTGIELSANRVKGGTSVTGRVLMSGPRQEIPQTLLIFENTTATALSSPTVQLLPGESRSEPFTVFTARVREPVRAVILADEGNFSVEEIAFLDIDPPFITSLEALQTTVVGGAPAQFRIVLDSPAPTNGMPINVSDDSTAILVPTIVVVPAGQTAVVFSAPTAVVASSRTAVVTATSNGISRSVTIAIVGVTMSLDPLSVVGGNPTTGTITLTSNAIINSVVFDLSDNSTATAPQTPTAIVPAGFRTGTFTVLTVPVTSTRSSTISASNGGVVRSVTMTVRVAALQSIIVSPGQVAGGNPFAGLVSLDGRAAGAGLTVALTSAAAFAQVPASLLIPAGQSQGLFVGTTTRPTTTLMIVISASLNGITRATTIIVSP